MNVSGQETSLSHRSGTHAPYSEASGAAPDESDEHNLEQDDSWSSLLPLEQLMIEKYNPDRAEVITIMFSFERQLSVEWFQNKLVPRLLSHPRFRSKLVHRRGNSYTFELIPGFSASHPSLPSHLHVEDVTSLSGSNPEQASIFASRLSDILATPLPFDRPLWNLHIFPKWSHSAMDRSLCTTVVFRVHHAIADGLGLLKYFLAKIVDVEPNRPSSSQTAPSPAHPSNASIPAKPPSNGPSPSGVDENEWTLLPPSSTQRQQQEVSDSRLAALDIGTPVNPLQSSRPRWPRAAIEFIDDLVSVTVKPLSRQPASAFTRGELETATLCALHPSLSLDVHKVKQAARRLGVTINDLLLAAFSGAMRSYLAARGDDPNQLHTIRAAVPFGRRSPSEPFRNTDIRNRLAMLPVSLPVDAPERTERLSRCSSTMNRLKRGRQPMIAVQALRMMSCLPAFARRSVWAHMASTVSVLMSNVPGPVEAVSVDGIEVSEIYFLPPAGTHVPVSAGVMSYNGRFFVGVCGEAGRLARPVNFVEAFADEIEALVGMSSKDCEELIQE